MSLGRQRYRVAGVEISTWPQPLVTGRVIDELRRGAHIHLVNAYSLVCAKDDGSVFRALTHVSAICLPDGSPVAWLSPHRSTRHVVRGASLFANVLSQGRAHDLRHYFVGGAPGVAESMAGVLEGRVPGVNIVGWESPPFREMTEPEFHELVDRVRQSRADVVWIGLGTPKQDLFGLKLFDQGGISNVAVGAAFDFFAGRVPEAPEWIQGSGFEWLYRLAREPRRLWRRYLIGNFRFSYIALKGRFRR